MINRILYNPDGSLLLGLARFRNTLQGLPYDFFTSILIETMTYCNRRCCYCPNSTSTRGIKENNKVLSIEKIAKIVDELADIGFRGVFYPHGYGEPLLDHRIYDICKMIKNKIPASKVGIHTNGDRLEYQSYCALVESGCDFILLTQHDRDPSEDLLRFLEKYNHSSLRKTNPVYHRMLSGSKLFNRGGLVAENIAGREILLRNCVLPQNTLVVNAAGDIVLCCNDYYSNHTWGKIGEDSIQKTWDRSDFKEARKKIASGLYEYELCKRCTRPFFSS